MDPAPPRDWRPSLRKTFTGEWRIRLWPAIATCPILMEWPIRDGSTTAPTRTTMPYLPRCFRGPARPPGWVAGTVFGFWVGWLMFPSWAVASHSFRVADGDVAALIAAMEAAQDGDWIDLAPDGLYRVAEVHNVTNGANGLPVVTRSIKIRGHGATIVREEDAPRFRLFYFQDVGEGSQLSDLTIRNGWVDDSDGGGIYLDQSHPGLSRIVMQGNRAPGGAGGAIHNRRSSPTVADSVFVDNVAESGGAMANVDGSQPMVATSLFLRNGSSLGGAMLNDGSGPHISGCLFKENRAWEGLDEEARGGGMANINQSTPTILDSRFERNEVYWGWGGGLYHAESSVVIANTEFIQNEAEPMGGGIFSIDASIMVADSLWANNWAMRHGGGMATVRSDVVVTHSVFRQNSGNDSGAGLYSGASRVTVAHSSFEDNTGDEGGGMANIRTDAVLIQCSFIGNVADEGGGLYNWRSQPTLTDCLFQSNLAHWDGGGILNVDSHPVLNNVAFEANSAIGRGGGMADLGESAATVIDSFFGGNTATTGGGIFGGGSSRATVGRTVFCENTPTPVAGPWEDLGTNSLNDTCQLTYGSWVREHFGTEDWEDETASGPRADPLGDGTPNIVKYALGLGLGQARPRPWVTPEVGQVAGEEYLTFTFSHPFRVADIDYRIQLSTDLVNWSEEAVLVASGRTGRMTTRTYRDLRPLSAAGTRTFMRLAVRLEE